MVGVRIGAGGKTLGEESMLIDHIVQRLDSVIWSGSGEEVAADLQKVGNIISFNQQAKINQAEETT